MIPCIEIIKGKPGWIKILTQEGIPFRIFTPGDNPPVLIVDTLTNDADIMDYLREGGTIITSLQSAGKLLGKTSRRTKIKYIIPDSSEFFRNVGIIDVYDSGFVLQGNGFGRINNNVPAIHELSYNKGICIGIPFDVDSLMCDKRSMMKFFCSQTGKFPTETVSTTSKAEIRKLIVNIIRYLFKKKNFYYINKWYYPGEKQSAFTFRIDTDASGFDGILKTFAIARKANVNFTFFIDFSNINIENTIQRFKELRNQELAVHCFEHKISKDPVLNRKNFSRARRALFSVGFGATGIAIPYGIWNNTLGILLDELGFKYSSEFSLSYDDLPFFPLIDNKFSRVLQIPVHPISPGSLLYSKFTTDEIDHYFKNIIQKKLESNEPLFFYGHSKVLSSEPTILKNILHTIEEKQNIWKGTYIEFYNWWIQRNKQHLEMTIDGDMLKIKGVDKKTGLSLQIIAPSAKKAVVCASDEINLKELDFSQVPKIEPFNRNELRTKKRALKLRFKEIENWIKR